MSDEIHANFDLQTSTNLPCESDSFNAACEDFVCVTCFNQLGCSLKKLEVGGGWRNKGNNWLISWTIQNNIPFIDHLLASSVPNLPHLHVAGSQASLPQEFLHYYLLLSAIEIFEGGPQLCPSRGCNLKMVATRIQCQPRNAKSFSGGKDRTSDRTNSLRILSLSLRRALTSHPKPNACMSSSLGFSLLVHGPIMKWCFWIHLGP